MLTYVLPEVDERYGLTALFLKSGERKRWQRRLFRRPSGRARAVWQVSGFARVNGISGPVDLNVAAVKR